MVYSIQTIVNNKKKKFFNFYFPTIQLVVQNTYQARASKARFHLNFLLSFFLGSRNLAN